VSVPVIPSQAVLFKASKPAGALQQAAYVTTAPAEEPAGDQGLPAQDQDMPENPQRHEAWQEPIKRLDPPQRIFVDARGKVAGMTRRYGHAPRGE
jgi:hypothetical protein